MDGDPTERAPVVNRAGDELGHVEAVLGDDENGIFHGLALNLKGWGGHVELPADRIERITNERVYTNLGPEEEKSLEDLQPDRWFEFQGRSRFFRRVKWGEDE